MRDNKSIQGNEQIDALLDLLLLFENDYICNDMSTTEYCEKHCKYACPQKECYMKYAEMKVNNEI